MKIPAKKKKQYKIVCLTMDIKLHNKLKELAKENKVSVSRAIKFLIDRGLDKSDKKEKRPMGLASKYGIKVSDDFDDEMPL